MMIRCGKFFWRLVCHLKFMCFGDGLLITSSLAHQISIIDILSSCIHARYVVPSLNPPFHALMECTFAKRFWQQVKDDTRVKLPFLHPRTWAHVLFYTTLCNREDACVILCGMWSLWSSRNDHRHGKESIHTQKVIEWAIDMVTWSHSPLACSMTDNNSQPTTEWAYLLPSSRWFY
jgi:hypothetical protein